MALAPENPAAASSGLPFPDTSTAPAKQSLPKAMLAVQMLVGGLGGFFFAIYALPRLGDDSLPELVALLCMSLLLLWIQVIVHEGGHALAGALTGRRIIGAGVGPLRLERGTGGWHARWGGGVRGIGGFAAMVPAEGREESLRDETLFLLGGPMANLVVAACASLVLVSGSFGITATVALGTTAACGALLGIVNLVPFRSAGWRSDGLGLRDLYRDNPDSRIARRLQRVLALSLAGVRPRDWPAEWLEIADGLAPDVAVAAHALRLSRSMDRGDDVQAGESARFLATAYPGIPDGRRQGIALAVAIYAAQTIRDPALLAAWRPLCEGGLLDLSASRAWLDAEAALMTSDIDAARTFAARARTALPRVHDAGSATVLGERLDHLEERLAG